MNSFNVIKDGHLPTMINILLFIQATVINAQHHCNVYVKVHKDVNEIQNIHSTGLYIDQWMIQ